jgi:hypothetical protein
VFEVWKEAVFIAGGGVHKAAGAFVFAEIDWWVQTSVALIPMAY